MLGAINHVALAVNDLERSDDFWKPLMNFLGYRKTLATDMLSVWESKMTGSAINFWATPSEQTYQYLSPGLHHLAFNAGTKEGVDDFYTLPQEIRAEILDTPATYDEYEPGYYAVYFKDINGFKIEFAHTPSTNVSGPKNSI